MQGYCVKCKGKRDIVGAKQITTKNGRAAMKGKCKTCGTTVMRFIKK